VPLPHTGVYEQARRAVHRKCLDVVEGRATPGDAIAVIALLQGVHPGHGVEVSLDGATAHAELAGELRRALGLRRIISLISMSLSALEVVRLTRPSHSSRGASCILLSARPHRTPPVLPQMAVQSDRYEDPLAVAYRDGHKAVLPSNRRNCGEVCDICRRIGPKACQVGTRIRCRVDWK
jgi:hypothetical protein